MTRIHQITDSCIIYFQGNNNRVNKPLVKMNVKQGGNKKNPASGLKITFNPAELARTTDKNVAAQVLYDILLDTRNLFIICI